MTRTYRNAPVPHQLPGCLLGWLLGMAVGWVGASAIFDLVSLVFPERATTPPIRAASAAFLLVVLVAAGVRFTRMYAHASERRWGGPRPDLVQMLRRDLPLLLLHGPGYRVRLPKNAGFSERVRHEALFILKWTGICLILTTVFMVLAVAASLLGVDGV